jgi:hypothetical protein
VAGIATFDDLVIDSVAAGYTFVASSAGTSSLTSGKFAVIPNLLQIGPTSVDAVFPTVPFFFAEGFGFTVGATTVNFAGVQASVTGITAQGQALSGTLSIPAGGAVGIGTVSVTTPFGTSNTLPIEIAGVGAATLQLGPPNGGSGGTPYSLDCPTGALATGINVNAGSNVNTLQVICQTITGATKVFGAATLTGTVGVIGGSPSSLTCPANFVMTGLSGRIGNGGSGVNDQIGVICDPVGPGGLQFISGLVGSIFSGSIAYQATCPSGLAVSGIQGGAGNLLDRTQIKCR